MRQPKAVQAGAERAGEKQPALPEGKIFTGRVQVKYAVNSKTIKMTVQALKDKESVGGVKATEQYPGSQAATHRPPIEGNLIKRGNARIGIQENLHNDTEGHRTKEERRNPHPKDDNRFTAHCQDINGMLPVEGQHAPQEPQD